jgi:probable phosphoglycerate mutase
MRRTLYVARHGETDWNAQLRWQGHTDVPLNETGRAQARVLAGVLRRTGLAGVVASDLVRAHETALIVAVELGLAVAYVDAALRERAFGVFEGLTREECETQHPEAWAAWLDSKRVPRGGEAHDVLTARVVAGLARVAREVATEDAPALVVTHGGALRAIVVAATGKAPPPVANGAVWRVIWDGGVTDAERVP